ncbi:MAG: YARHG domain-containing protein, partial [Nitrososphaeraceae archaeon]|nr:YARHG domain-containing protein [Nitrososphaeraceae archaeon]
TEKLSYDINWFGGLIKYGISNDSLQLILDTAYDKIINPNLTLKNCFEIKSGSQYGLFNYKTREVLKPQFEVIFPSNEANKQTAYGLLDHKWYAIDFDNITKPYLFAYNPNPSLRTLNFDVDDINQSIMYDSYWREYEDEPNIGRGVVLIPSYLAYLGLMEDDYTDVILAHQANRIDFGTDAAEVKLIEEKSISDQVKAFFFSLYEYGIDARGYESSHKKMVVSNQKLNTFDSEEILGLNSYDYFCEEGDYKFINDSILEVKFNTRQYEYKQQKYAFETRYEYYHINKVGFLQKLRSNRYYDFTKFIIIENYHLEGCFAWELTDPEYMQDYNMWIADHLSIEDLDMMRNEIFADYGYKFKSEEWKDYFSSKYWYKPLYDDVN